MFGPQSQGAGCFSSYAPLHSLRHSPSWSMSTYPTLMGGAGQVTVHSKSLVYFLSVWYIIYEDILCIIYIYIVYSIYIVFPGVDWGTLLMAGSQYWP